MTQTLVHTLVKDCMTPQLISVSPYDTLARAWELMSVNRIRRLPVLDGGKLCGIITWSDILAAQRPDPAHRQSREDIARDLGRLVVSTTMARDPVCIFDNDTVGHAAELMLQHKIGGLPVLNLDKHLVGLITESNLFRLLAESWREDNLIFSGARKP